MTPLFKKLNFKNNKTILVLNAPASFQSELIKMEGIADIFHEPNKINSTDFALIFATKLTDIEARMKAIYNLLEGDAIIWFCYPKASSKKYKCDFNRDTGWNALGAFNIEPVRQVAIDEDWSALRFRKVEYIKKMTRSFAISDSGKSRVKNV